MSAYNPVPLPITVSFNDTNGTPRSLPVPTYGDAVLFIMAEQAGKISNLDINLTYTNPAGDEDSFNIWVKY